MGIKKQPVSDYIKVERSREARHWISDVILPIVGIGMYIKIVDPEFGTKIADAGKKVVNKGKNLVHKVFKPKSEEKAEE